MSGAAGREDTRILRQRYLLEREIGRGATGSVWVARDLQLGRHVAVKLLYAEGARLAPARESFQSEARSLAKLRNPHVVQVFDAGTDGQCPFIVMELLEGETLDDRLRRTSHRPFSIQAAAELVSALARGLTMIHRAGLVHRDLKPGNVFLALEQGGEIPKILDFGLVSSSARHETRNADPAPILGTPAYMSPEQFGGCAVDEQADLWALAVMTYQLVTGRHPFLADTLIELKARVQQGLYETPSQIGLGLDDAVDAFFRRAFSASPESRFPSAMAFAAELLCLAKGPSLTTKVLIVDDEPDIQLLLEQRFHAAIREGRYAFYFAANGEEGLRELARQTDLDVVLTDLNMPVMDGLTFLGKASALDPYVRVVVVSAYSDLSNIRTAMNRGAFDFLCKPIDFGDLERTVDRAAVVTASLRHAHRLHEEQGILNALLRSRGGEGVLTGNGPTGGISPQSLDGILVTARLRGCASLFRMRPAALAVERLNSRLEIVIQELSQRSASTVRLNGNIVLAAFCERDALQRAVDACLAARERLVELDARGGTAAQGVPEVSFAVTTGPIVLSGPGGPSHGIEEVLLGEACEVATALQRAPAPYTILANASLESALRREYSIDLLDALPNLPMVQVHGHARGVSGPNECTHADCGQSLTTPIPFKAWADEGS